MRLRNFLNNPLYLLRRSNSLLLCCSNLLSNSLHFGKLPFRCLGNSLHFGKLPLLCLNNLLKQAVPIYEALQQIADARNPNLPRGARLSSALSLFSRINQS